MEKRTGKFQSGILIALVLAVAVAAGVLAFILFNTSGATTDLGQEYVYDISQYINIDPSLILYHQIGETIQADLESANAIAVDTTGQIYVAGDQQIAVYTASGEPVRRIELDDEPTAIVIDKEGTIIIGVSNHIILLNSQGSPIRQWDIPAHSPDGVIVTSIAADKDEIFAADALGKVVRCFSHEGQLLNTIGEKDPTRNIPGFVVPSPYFDIAMAADGLLRVVNPGRHLIEAYTVNGDREWAWGETSVSIEGFSGCCNPINFSILPDGGFVTAEKGLVRIKKYDADGKFVGVVAGPDQLDWDRPQQACQSPEECSAKGFDVAAGSDGRIYILDMVRNNIRIFEKK